VATLASHFNYSSQRGLVLFNEYNDWICVPVYVYILISMQSMNMSLFKFTYWYQCSQWIYVPINWLIDLFLVFNTTFSYIMATSFNGGRSRSTRREPATMGKQLVNFYHLRLRVECTLFCNLQSWVRTHAVLVIGLYELLGIQLHNSLSHPGPVVLIEVYIWIPLQSMNMCRYSSVYTDTNAVHEYVSLFKFIYWYQCSPWICDYSSLYTDTNAVHEYVSLFKFIYR
jgi:hypothetical protein